MKLGRIFLFIIYSAICLPFSALADDDSLQITITENTNPKIIELYQQLQDTKEQLSNINSKRTSALKDNANAMQEKEQSQENRILTSATTAATGIGGMELARGLSEQKADKEARNDMLGYVSTFECEYGGGHKVNGGPDEVQLPVIDLTSNKTKYKELAESLKIRKEALGMKPGLESEEILERTSLYDEENVGITGSSLEEGSIYRAEILKSESDAEKMNNASSATDRRIKGGATSLGVGAVVGIVGNAIINKDAPKESSDQINAEYDKQLADATAKQTEIENRLNQIIAENSTRVQEYNQQLQQHKNQIATINRYPTNCQELLAEYVDLISELSPIENETDAVPDIELPDVSEQQNLLAQCSQCYDKGGIFDYETLECPCPFDRPIEQDGKCVEKPVESAPVVTPQPEEPVDIETDGIESLNPLLSHELIGPLDEQEESPEDFETIEESLETDNDEENNIQNEPTIICTDEELLALGEHVKTAVKNDDKCEIDECEDEYILSEDKTKCEPKQSDEETEPDAEYCPATGNRLKSINDKTKIGDECSSTNIAAGEVVWAKTKQPKTICTCLAYVCNNGYHSVSGRCDKDVVKQQNCPRQEYNNVPNIKTGNDALKFCEEKGGKQCKTVNAIKDYTGIKGKVLCNASQDEFGAAKERMADSKLKYYTCGKKGAIPQGIDCKFVLDFQNYRVTPMEADGLMKEWALKKYNDNIKCDTKSHRDTKEQGKYADNYRQCVSKTNNNKYYEFVFFSLSDGNAGFYDALCSIWGLKSGRNLCKDANKQQCNEISAAINRTFYIGGSAELQKSNTTLGTRVISSKDVCVIRANPKAESAPVALFNTKVLTQDDMRTVGNIDPLHFYDKKLQINANSDVYKTITNYLFVEQRLPVKQFSCGAGFVDNTTYYNVSRQKYNENQEEIRKCQQNSQIYSGGGEHGSQMLSGCIRQNQLDSKSGDLLSCEYDGKPIDFLFKKLDVTWNRKSTAGYQGLLCLSEGGSFTGKSCTLANKEQCNSFNAKFKKDYPNSKGMEWDEEMGTCVLKDARYVSNVQKVAETTGLVVLTLVTAAAGGPIVWALSVVEGGAFVTEAVTEEKINDWAEVFLVDAAKCNNNSTCANGVMRKHIARIIAGSNQFNDTQNKQIALQTERLMGMLDEKTVSAIIDKGASSGYIGDERDPDLENSIRDYYGTKLTSQEKTLLVTKKVATVLTFTTLIGAGVTAGLRQAVKHNWINLSPTKQAKWLKWKILKPGDVATLTPKTTVEMTPAQAKKLEELDARIAKLESKTNRTADEVAQLRKLRQERNTLLNKVGTKDADELAELSGAAFDKKAVEDATTEYNKVMERRNYVADYMNKHNGNPPQGMSKYDIQEINNNVSKAEQKLKDFGQDITPAEPLQIGKKPTISSTETTPKPTESTTKPKEKPVDDANKSSKSTRDPVANPVKPKSEKIAEARQRGDLGYHGTDADIAMDDMIRSSTNTSDQLGSVGYGIAKDYDAAEKYAIRRLIENQNIGKNIKFYRENNVLIIESNEPLNLSNKTGYVYTTAKESSVQWTSLQNGYVGVFDAAQMPHSVEILDKKAFNLDDLIRQGKVKIIEPKPAKTTGVASGIGSTPKATASTTSKTAGKADDIAKAAKNTSGIDYYLSRSTTLQNLNKQGRLNFVTSSSLDGKQYLRISMGQNPNMQEAQEILKKLQNEGFYVSSNSTKGGEKFIGVSQENIFGPWNKSSNNWLLNRADDVANATNDARRISEVARKAIPSDFSPSAKNFINEINEVGTTREYAVSRGIGAHNNQSSLSKQETDYIRQLLNDREDLIARNVSQPDGSGRNLGANWFVTKKTNDMFVDETNTVLRRINTRPINNLRGKSITTINGKSVFLEPLDNGGLIGNVSGRPVVVVNYNGHRIPFYASSGSAGKLDVPTGKWEVFFGFGKGTKNPGWFNKGDIDQIVGHYGSPELKKIAEALDNAIGDQRNIEDVFATISRKMYNGKGIVASYDGPVASKDFINSLLDFTPADYGAGNGQLLRNIEYVKGYFK